MSGVPFPARLADASSATHAHYSARPTLSSLYRSGSLIGLAQSYSCVRCPFRCKVRKLALWTCCLGPLATAVCQSNVYCCTHCCTHSRTFAKLQLTLLDNGSTQWGPTLSGSKPLRRVCWQSGGGKQFPRFLPVTADRCCAWRRSLQLLRAPRFMMFR